MRSFAFLMTASALVAQVPEYWPLAPGNQWVYRAPIGEPLTVTVDRTESIGGRDYAVLTGLGEDLRLRQGDTGTLFVYDMERRAERIYVDFAAPLGQNFTTAANSCNPTAAIADRDARVKLPLGEFGGVIEVRYNPGQCADAGLTQDLYLPYVGLMRRTETTIIGPRVFDLVYARINGVLLVTSAEAGFGVSAVLDGNRIHTRMTLRNTTSTPIVLNYSSSQEFDIRLLDAKGETVYVWSSTRLFLQVLKTIEVRGERNWSAVVPTPTAPGRYTLEAWLTTREGIFYKASTAIDVPAQ